MFAKIDLMNYFKLVFLQACLDVKICNNIVEKCLENIGTSLL
jgi:hypothetical protein